MSFSKVQEQGREALKVEQQEGSGETLPAAEFSSAPARWSPLPLLLSPRTIEAEGCAWVLVEARRVGREGKWECENRAGPKRSCKTGPEP